MGIITHLGRRAGRLRRLWRYVRRFVIPLRRCERFPRIGGLLKFAAPGRFHRRSPPRISSAAVLTKASERWWRRTSCEDDALLTRCSSNVELPFLASLAGGRRSLNYRSGRTPGPTAVAREGQESSQLRRPRPRSAMSGQRRLRPLLGIGRLPEFTASRVASQFEFERLDASLALATRFLYAWRKARKKANEPSREDDDRMCG